MSPTACSRGPIAPEGTGPAFMGLGRNGWRGSPAEMVDHFGTREACARWEAEWQGYLERVRASGDRAKEILLNTTSRRARKIMRERGAMGLCAAYDADPTFGQKRRSA